MVHVAESTQQVFLTAEGQGEEPQLEFCPSVLELGPCLPVSTEAEAELTVKNPCSFPIEFYCLELDTQYLEEEKVAQTISLAYFVTYICDRQETRPQTRSECEMLINVNLGFMMTKIVR